MNEKITATETLRAKHRSARASLSGEQLIANSTALAMRIEQLAEFGSASHIASYIAIRGEIDVRPLMQQVVDKRYYLPVIQDTDMHFAPWAAGDVLVKKKFGLLEPDCDAQQFIAPQALDLVIVPLVVFDQQCNRIGQGGGYYDRTFEFLLERENIERPVLLGVAHECQREAILQSQQWDVPLDFVVTESSVYTRACA